MSLRRPVLLVVDDLQFADDDTADLVLFLMRHLRRARVMVMATYRSEDSDRSLLDDLGRSHAAGRLIRLDLGPFDDTELAALVAARTGHAPDADLVAVLQERTGGQPFFAVAARRLPRGAGARAHRRRHGDHRAARPPLAAPRRDHRPAPRLLARTRRPAGGHGRRPARVGSPSTGCPCSPPSPGSRPSAPTMPSTCSCGRGSWTRTPTPIGSRTPSCATPCGPTSIRRRAGACTTASPRR